MLIFTTINYSQNLFNGKKYLFNVHECSGLMNTFYLFVCQVSSYVMDKNNGVYIIGLILWFEHCIILYNIDIH